jgi:hypothetical protein
MASALHKATVVKSERLVALSDDELPGLSDSYGPNADVLKNLSDHIQSSLDGVLLIDDLDRLISFSSGQVALETGSRILNVARRYPGRLIVICTGSRESFTRLDPGNRWLGQLNVRRIEFFALAEEALRQIFMNLLSNQGFELASDAERALRIQIKEIMHQGGDEFDNVYAIRRFVDSVLHNYGLRARQRSGLGSASKRVIVADDIRDAFSSV